MNRCAARLAKSKSCRYDKGYPNDGSIWLTECMPNAHNYGNSIYWSKASCAKGHGLNVSLHLNFHPDMHALQNRTTNNQFESEMPAVGWIFTLKWKGCIFQINCIYLALRDSFMIWPHWNRKPIKSMRAQVHFSTLLCKGAVLSHDLLVILVCQSKRARINRKLRDSLIWTDCGLVWFGLSVRFMMLCRSIAA